MLSPPIETVIFDLDGTLRHRIPSADDIQFQVARMLGLVDAPDNQVLGARWAHYYWAQSPELAEDIGSFGPRHDYLESEFWVNYEYRYLCSLNVPEEKAAAMAPSMVEHLKAEYKPEDHVYPCVHETLGKLKEAGFILGLVSNRPSPCQDECQELGLLEYFDFVYVAGEVDAWKPNPRIFDRALELTASPPERIVYVGDNYYADILGAEKAHLQPVLLDEKGIFPEAACMVLRRLGELVELLI